jgi:hypothetical protein
MGWPVGREGSCVSRLVERKESPPPVSPAHGQWRPFSVLVYPRTTARYRASPRSLPPRWSRPAIEQCTRTAGAHAVPFDTRHSTPFWVTARHPRTRPESPLTPRVGGGSAWSSTSARRPPAPALGRARRRWLEMAAIRSGIWLGADCESRDATLRREPTCEITLLVPSRPAQGHVALVWNSFSFPSSLAARSRYRSSWRSWSRSRARLIAQRHVASLGDSPRRCLVPC